MAQNSFPVRQQLKRFPTNHRKYVVHQTASKMLAYGDTGSTHTNLGAAGGVTLTLPQNADKGVAFTFSVMAGQTLTIDPGAAGAIYIGGAKLADDASIASAEIGDTVTLECDGNHDWTVTAISGSWGQSEGAQILTDLDLGASGTAGSLDIFPTTASKGKVRFTATDNTNDDALTITNAAMGQASTLTIPDPGDSADEFVLKDKTQTLTGKTLTSPVLTTPQINDTSADHQYIVAVNELAADRTITLPILTGNDEVVFKDHAVTLTNKTLTSPAINTPLLGDGDAGLTLTSADQTHATPTATVPDLGDAADTFVMADTTQTLTNKTLTTPVIGSITELTAGSGVAVDTAVIRDGAFHGVQGNPTAETGVTTITIADILTGIVTVTHTTGATIALTVDTGTDMDAGMPASFGIGSYIDWSIINISAAAADTVTLTAAADHTLVGIPIVQSAHTSTGDLYGNAGRFRSRRTASTTWITYKLA